MGINWLISREGISHLIPNIVVVQNGKKKRIKSSKLYTESKSLDSLMMYSWKYSTVPLETVPWTVNG